MSNQSQQTTIQQRYLAGEPNTCPTCRSSEVEGDEVTINGKNAEQTLGCLNCGDEWTDVYQLVRVDSTDFNPDDPATNA